MKVGFIGIGNMGAPKDNDHADAAGIGGTEHDLVAAGELFSYLQHYVRLEPRAPFLPRVTAQEVEVCGHMIPAGTTVSVNISSVNREPEGEGDFDAVDLERGGGRHFGFGGGVHRCLGSHLARGELQIVLEEFHRRIAEYELEPGFEPVVPWPAGALGLQRLPLVLHS